MAALIIDGEELEVVGAPAWSTSKTRQVRRATGFTSVMPEACYIAATVRVPARVPVADLNKASAHVQLIDGDR